MASERIQRAELRHSRGIEQLALDAARKQLALLTVRQQTTLRHRFGIDMERDHTLQEIGDMLLITRERAR